MLAKSLFKHFVHPSVLTTLRLSLVGVSVEQLRHVRAPAVHGGTALCFRRVAVKPTAAVVARYFGRGASWWLLKSAHAYLATCIDL